MDEQAAPRAELLRTGSKKPSERLSHVSIALRRLKHTICATVGTRFVVGLLDQLSQRASVAVRRGLVWVCERSAEWVVES